MKRKYKWKHKGKLYLCKCGICFRSRKHFFEHLKDSKRWKKYHYAPDFNEIAFIIWEKGK